MEATSLLPSEEEATSVQLRMPAESCGVHAVPPLIEVQILPPLKSAPHLSTATSLSPVASQAMPFHGRLPALANVAQAAPELVDR